MIIDYETVDFDLANFYDRVEYKDTLNDEDTFPGLNIAGENQAYGYIDAFAGSAASIDRDDAATIASEQAFEGWHNSADMRRDAIAASQSGGVAIRGAVMASVLDDLQRLGNRILDGRDIDEYNGLSDYQMIADHSDAELLKGALGDLEDDRKTFDDSKQEGRLILAAFTPESIEA